MNIYIYVYDIVVILLYYDMVEESSRRVVGSCSLLFCRACLLAFGLSQRRCNAICTNCPDAKVCETSDPLLKFLGLVRGS